jgi:Cd2+/Zn2+-exporting ATPase
MVAYPPRGDIVTSAGSRYRSFLLSRQFILAALAAVFILVSAILSLAGAGFWVHTSLALVAVAIAGIPIVRDAVVGLWQRQMNVDELVAIAIIASLAYQEYLSAAFVAFMMQFGKLLEDFTAARATTALEDLGKMVPDTACVRRGGRELTLPVNEIVVGDAVIVRSGERIPVDGMIVSGQASVNQAPITGESVPVPKTKGSEVYACTLNEIGAIEVKATKVGDCTVASQMARLVEEAEENRAPIVRVADRFAKYFTPIILAFAALAYVVTRDVMNSLAVLIVACPCALVLATPIAVVAGVANGARRGILIKGGARLEAAGRVTAVAFDKTGTITLGKPELVKIVTLDHTTEEEVLTAAAVAERLSEHPLGKAVLARARQLNLDVPDADEFKVFPGQGVTARLDGKVITVGSETLMKESGIVLPANLAAALDNLEKEGLSPLLVASSGKALGIIGVADNVRDDMRQAIRSLKELGVSKVVMLTGDSPEVANRVATAVGIESWQARLLPQQKVEYIRAMQGEGYRVAMLGDGINDAPALAQAEVGIAIGVNGADVTMDVADIVLMRDDAIKAAEAISLSRKTLKTIKQNIGFAFVINLIGVGLASSGILSPIAAALFHNVGSVAVVINSARLVGWNRTLQS